MTERPEPDRDEDDALAGEYALGLLEGEDLARARAREAADPAFREAVRLWHERLAPLAEELAPVVPPARLRRELEDRLFAPDAGAPAGLFGRMRGLSLAALAAVAVVAGILAVVLPVPEPGPVYRAEIASADGAILIAARREGEDLLLERSRGAAAPGRALELWVIAGDAAPVSLGVLPEAAAARLRLPEALRDALAPGAILAVSDEPEGGSPTGQPTGAVLATGEITDL